MTLQLNSQEKVFNLLSPVFLFLTYFSLLFNIYFFLNRVIVENEEQTVLERVLHFLLRDKAMITVGRGLTVVAVVSIILTVSLL